VIGGKLFTPVRPGVKVTKTTRDILGIITFFARKRQVINLIYRRMRDGAIIQRSVEPYSLRYLRTKFGGRARYFYGYDLTPPTIGIHSFRLNNILAVSGTEGYTFVPRWVVEF
jgi:predicted DNA-binding transcriptional regulator YafY